MSIILEEREMVSNKPLNLAVILMTRFCLEREDAEKLVAEGAIVDAEGNPFLKTEIVVNDLRGARIFIDQLQPAIDHHVELSRKRMAVPIPR